MLKVASKYQGNGDIHSQGKEGESGIPAPRLDSLLEVLEQDDHQHHSYCYADEQEQEGISPNFPFNFPFGMLSLGLKHGLLSVDPFPQLPRTPVKIYQGPPTTARGIPWPSDVS